MTDSSDASDVIQRRERKINRRTLTYGVSVVLATAVLVIAIVWLGSRRGECFGTDTLLCSQKDRRLAVFVPSLMLLLGTVGAFLRAPCDCTACGASTSGRTWRGPWRASP